VITSFSVPISYNIIRGNGLETIFLKRMLAMLVSNGIYENRIVSKSVFVFLVFNLNIFALDPLKFSDLFHCSCIETLKC